MINPLLKVLLISITLLPGLTTGAQDNTDTSCLPTPGNRQLIPEDIRQTLVIPLERRTPVEYEQTIQGLEVEGGVYNPALIQELIGQGLQHQEAGNHREAAAAFERAMYIIRITDGLYSNKQLPLLDLLITSHTALNEWETVANEYDQMRWLFGRNYESDDPNLLPTLRGLRHWYLNAYNKETKRRLRQLYQTSGEIYQQAIDTIEKCTGDRRTALCFWHRACCAGAPPEYGICPVKLPEQDIQPDAGTNG